MSMGKSEAARRENDELLATLRGLGRPDGVPLVCLCECDDPDCEGFVRLTIEELEKRRREGSLILYPGHQPTG